MAKFAHELLAETRDFLAGLPSPVTGFVGSLPEEMEARPLEAAPLPCLRHLDACAALAEGTSGESVARLLAGHRQRLHWGQTYTQADFDRRFLDNYGWLELFGKRGHFVEDRIACGFLLLGPGTHYPDHHHEAEEIYIPLTGGASWKKGDGPFATQEAGAVIHHPSNVNHAMQTAGAPLLALYLWRGGPLAAKSTLAGNAGG